MRSIFGSLGSAALLLLAVACGTSDPTTPTSTAPDPTGFTLTIEMPENGEILVDPPDGPYPAGTLVRLTAQTSDRFAFDGWTGDLSGSIAERSIFMNRDRTIGANFRPLGEFTLDVSGVTNGSIVVSPPGGPYLEGTEITLTAEADPGFGFTGWTGDVTGVDNPKTIRITSDRTVGATFDAGVIVEVLDPPGGTVTTNPPIASGQFLPHGTTLQVTAFPDPGFDLDAIYRKIWIVEPDLPYYPQQRTFGFSMPVTLSPDDGRFRPDGALDKVVLGAFFLPEDTWGDIVQTDGITYASPGSKPLGYDIYAPSLASDLPMVILVHGGGYERQSEDVMRGVGKAIASTGRYVVFAVDYRLATDLDPEPPTPADAVRDVLGAIAHARGNATLFGADPDRIALVGEDVGGHLATLVPSIVDRIGDGGYDGTLASEFEPTHVPVGTTLEELREELTTAIRATATAYGIFEDPEWDEAVDPFANIPDAAERALPPQWFQTGAVDLIASPADVRAYTDALIARGQPAQRVPSIPFVGHGYLEWEPDPVARLEFDDVARPALDSLVDFLDETFAP